MAWLLLAISMCIGLAACGSDDDDDNGVVSGKSELVGKWMASDWGFKLDANGYGYEWEGGYRDGELVVYDKWVINWTFKNNILSLIDEDGDPEQIRVTYMDESTMLYQWVDGSGQEDYTMTKVRNFPWE